MMVFEYLDTLFVVDAGLMFPEDYMLGVDFAIPDMEYLRENQKKLAGVVLTHGHEDHIGALPYLLKMANVPVFGSPFTMGLVRHKLEEHGILAKSSLHVVHPGEKLRINEFELEFIQVGHSVIDGLGLCINSPVGRIIHTGDFKINNASLKGPVTDVTKFAQFGAEGVLALLSDSTNVEKEGYTKSAKEIGEILGKIMTDAKGRIIIALFASNITRIQMVVDIARALGRKVVINGRSLEVSVNIAKHLKYFDKTDDIEIDIHDVNHYPDEEIVIITTGSQGEPMSALARIASGNHKQISAKKGDTVILSSKFIPGNEKAITKIINDLYRQGADVIYEKISNIHVSGHAFQEELKLMINLTRPKYFMPIHGEYRHLILHTRLAEGMGIKKENILLAENGQVVEFDRTGGRVRGTVPTGRTFVDGKGIGDVGRSVLKDRQTLSEDGLVVVTLAFDEDTGIVVYGPEVMSRGFVFEHLTGHLIDDAQCVILEAIEDIGLDVPNRVEKIRTRLQKDLKQYFFFTIGRKPMILPFVLEL
ncbi:MAG: ribonuclease J [Desulfobacteraceae bacterium]|nr:ribonuclease J [Desulfobacteraceae bacterium]MBU4053367.1 ribonuclease J [Pseudomonadota bacterium]